jgi:hypothetical protein
MAVKAREVAYYGDPGRHLFESVYSYKTFCGSCERELPNGFYFHLGGKFCPYCGQELERGEIENLGPKSVHPLVAAEVDRKAREEAEEDRLKFEQPDATAPRCDKCEREVLFAHGDEERERLTAEYPEASVMTAYLAAKITCKGCGRVLHNCIPRWTLERGYEPSCGAAGLGLQAVSDSNPLDPYGLHIAVPRVGESRSSDRR